VIKRFINTYPPPALLSSHLVVARNVASTAFNRMFGLADGASHKRTAPGDWAKDRPAKWCANNWLEGALDGREHAPNCSRMYLEVRR